MDGSCQDDKQKQPWGLMVSEGCLFFLPREKEHTIIRLPTMVRAIQNVHQELHNFQKNKAFQP